MSKDRPADNRPGGVPEERLVRTDGDRGLSLAERMSASLHRLAWRSPVHSLRLKGRHPLKLVAVADDPFLGDITRGRALLGGALVWRGETHPIADLSLAKPKFSSEFGKYLHSFQWLRDLSSVATRAEAAPIAEAVMRDWLAVHEKAVTEPAWRPDQWGRRILFWTAHAPLILSSTDLVYRSRVLSALARGARHLERTAGKAPMGMQRMAAWSGVMVAGLLLPGGDSRLAVGEAGLRRAIGAWVSDDGGTAARSPTRQAEAITLLTLVRSAYAARRIEPPEFLTVRIEAMLAALTALCMGDGGTSSWQGAGPIAGDTIAQMIDATGARIRPLRNARDWGYQRIEGGNSVLVLDAAPPPVARMVEGGCASTLAFELSEGPHRLIVNCGGARTAEVALPRDLTEGLRTSAAHSTLILADSNSTAIHPDGTLGKGVTEVSVNRHESAEMQRIEASHDGYARRFGFLHRRQIIMSRDGSDIRGEDSLIPAGKRQKPATPFAIRFHLGVHVDASPTADGLAALLRLTDGSAWQLRCKGAVLGIEESLWVDAKGGPRLTGQIVLSGEAGASGATVTWLLRRSR